MCPKCKTGSNEKGHSGYPDGCFHCDSCPYVECAEDEEHKIQEIMGDQDRTAMRWEDRFDDMLKGYLVLTDGDVTLEKPRNKIKQFIRELLSSQVDEMISWTKNHKLYRDGSVGEWESGHINAEEEFRSDVIAKLQSKKKNI